MAYLLSLEDIENDPELKILGRPQPGLNMSPMVAVEDSTGLPDVSDDMVQAPSVSITVEAPRLNPDPVAAGDLVMPEVIGVPSISVDPAPEPNVDTEES